MPSDLSKWIQSLNSIIMHLINSRYNFSTQNSPQHSDRVQFQFQSPKSSLRHRTNPPHSLVWSCVMVQDLLSRDVKLFPENWDKSAIIIYAMRCVSLRQVAVIFGASFLSLQKV